VKDQKPIRTARRKTRQLNRAGSDHPTCLYCGCSEVALLIPVKKRFLEAHHVLGESHDTDLTILLCRNCHYRATENLLRADVKMLPEPGPIKRAVIMLRGLSVHHGMLEDTLWNLAMCLEDSQTESEQRK
jgi:hypothetical protein